MANERLRITDQEARQEFARQFLTQHFAEPHRFASRPGFKLKPDEPMGVLTKGTVMNELELQGFNSADRRALAAKITAPLMKNEPLGIFPIASRLGIVTEHIGEDIVHYRSDISSKDQAIKRLRVYEEELRREVEEHRQNDSDSKAGAKKEVISKKEQRRRERAKRLAAMPPSTAEIVVIGPISAEFWQEEIKNLQDANPEGTKELGGMSYEVIPDPGLSVLHRQDVRLILEQGIPEERWEATIAKVRRAIVLSVENLETQVGEEAKKAVEKVEEQVREPGKKITLPVGMGRNFARVAWRALTNYNENPQITITEDIEALDPAGEYFPLPTTVIEVWNSRYDPKALGARFERGTMAGLDDKTSRMVRALIDSPEAEVLAKRLVQEGEVVVDDRKLTKTEWDESLAEPLLSEDLIARAMLADILGELYPLPYFSLSRTREYGLLYLRGLADKFRTQDIKRLVAPVNIEPSDIIGNIERLKNNVAATNAEISKIKGANAKKKELEGQLKEQTAQWRKAVAESKKARIKTTETVISDVISTMKPSTQPLPDQFLLGEHSTGYQRALDRFKVLSEVLPELEPPDPEDFKEGEVSHAYEEELGVYNAFSSLQPVSWSARDQRMYEHHIAKGSHKRINALISTPVLK